MFVNVNVSGVTNRRNLKYHPNNFGSKVELAN